MSRDRSRRGGPSGAGAEAESELAPGKRALTDNLGKPKRRGGSAVPGRTMLTDRIPLARSSITGAKPGKMPPAVKRAMAEPGSPLPDAAMWSAKFGANLAPVRLVTGVNAERAAQAVDARAFTLGERIFFGKGVEPSHELLAHELTHVVQQQGASMPAVDDLQVTSPDDAVEREAHANETNPGAVAQGSGAVIARDEKYTTTAEYITANTEHLRVEVPKHLDALAGSLTGRLKAPFVTWGTGGAAAAVNLLKGAVSNGQLFGMMGVAFMRKFLEPRGLEFYVDQGRVLTRTSQDGVSVGDDTWADDVATAVAGGLISSLGEGLDRIGGRYIQAKAAAQQRAWNDAKSTDPTLQPEPATDDIICSHPADIVLASAAVNSRLFAADLDGWRKSHPELANATTVPKLRKDVVTSVVAESAAVIENPGQWFVWIRSNPADATAEEAALSMFGAPEEAFRFHVKTPPLFAFSATMVWTLPSAIQDKLVAGSPRLAAEKERRKHLDDGKPHLIGFMVPRPMMDDPQSAAPLKDPTAGLPPALADEAALANAKANTPLGPDGKPKPTRPKDAILAQMWQNELLLGDIDKLAQKMAVGADASHMFMPTGGLVSSVQLRIDDRRKRLATVPDGDVAPWDVQASQQADIVGEVIAALTDLDKQIATMNQGQNPPAGTALYNISRSMRLPLVRTASAYVNAAASSELPDAARGQLVAARAQMQSAPADMMDLVLGEIQQSLSGVQDKTKSDQAGAVDREAKLRVDIAKLRQALLAQSPEAKTLMTSIWAQIQDLQTETTMITNIDGLDQAWVAMGDLASSFGVWGDNEKRLRLLQDEVIKFKEQWDQIHNDWKAAGADETKKQAVKARFDTMRNDPKLADCLSRMQAAMKTAAQAAMVARLIAMLAIAVVTAGVGAYVSGVAAGAMGVAAGAEATGTAAVVVGASATVAEAVTAATLNQAFFARGWDWGQFGEELAYNILLFGALRGVSGVLKLGKLGEFLDQTGKASLAEGGAQALTVSLGAVLKAKHDAKGRDLTAEETADIIAESTVSFVVTAVLGRAGKPFLQKLEGAGNKLGTAIAEANTARRVAAEAARGFAGKDLKKLKAVMDKDAESLKKDIAALEELQRSATDPNAREMLKQQGMADADIDAIARELPSNLIRLKVAEALGNAEQAGGNNFNLPKDALPTALAKLQQAGAVVTGAGTDPVTGARAYEAKFQDGTSIKVFEKASAPRPGSAPGTMPTAEEAAAARAAADEAEAICKRRDEQLTRLIQQHRGGYIVVDEAILGAGQAGTLANAAMAAGGAPPGVDITAIPARINIAPEGSMFGRHGDFPIGQTPGELAAPANGHQPGEFHSDHSKPINASDYVRSLTMTSYESGQVTYRATADNIEINPRDGTWPVDAACRITADGVTIYVKGRMVSAMGMGAGRSTLIKGEAALIAAKKLVFAQDSLSIPGAQKIVIIGAGPSGEWAVERAISANVEVIWMGRIDGGNAGAQLCPPEVRAQMQSQGVPEDKIDFFWKAYNKRTAQLATKSAFDNIGTGPGKVQLRSVDLGEATIDPVTGKVHIGDLVVDGVVAATGQVANLPPGLADVKFKLVVVNVDGRPRLVGLDPVDANGQVIPNMRLVGAQAINPAMVDHVLPDQVAQFRALSEEASTIDVPELSKNVRGSIHQTNKSVPAAIDAMPAPATADPPPATANPPTSNYAPPVVPVPDDKRDPGDGISIMRAADGPAPSRVPHVVTEVLEREQGSPLPDPDPWSQRVGGDVKSARIIKGDGAAKAAKALEARAFTVGNRIFFGSGVDETTDGGDLLAHELTHVTQQAGSSAPATWGQLPIVDHGDPREVAARANEGGAPTGGQAIAMDSTAKPKPNAPAAPAADPNADPAARQRMEGALPLVTSRWKALAGDLFSNQDKVTIKPFDFESGAYSYLIADQVDTPPVVAVLKGPNRKDYFDAYVRAGTAAERDIKTLALLKADILDLVGGGDLHYNATRIMAHYASLTPFGKHAVAVNELLGMKDLAEYLKGECRKQGALEPLPAEKTWWGGEVDDAEERKLVAGQRRQTGCESILATLKVGTPPVLPPVEVKAATGKKPSQETQAKVDTLKTAINTAKPGKSGVINSDQTQLLINAFNVAGSEAREIVWKDKSIVAKLVALVDPKQAQLVVAALDPVEELFQACSGAQPGDDKENWAAINLVMQAPTGVQFQQNAKKDIKLKANGGVFSALHDFLVVHASDQPMRMRLLQHTRLKNLYIDRLAPDDQRVIYRMIAHGTAEPTAEDMVQEAAEKPDAVGVVRGLQALAAADPVKLAALEHDPIFRATIDKLTALVEVDGQQVRPNQVALTLWGHNVGGVVDPNSPVPTEIDLDPNSKPLSINERVVLNTQLFDPALQELDDEIAGKNYNAKDADQYYGSLRHNSLGDPQKVMDILVKYDRMATERYMNLLRREHLVFGPELDMRFNRRTGVAIRTWVFEHSGPVNRAGSNRVLGTEQGAGVGMFNGQMMLEGEAGGGEGKMTLEQSLRETSAKGVQSVSETASIESHNMASGISDSNKEAVLSAWRNLDSTVHRAHDRVLKESGVSIRTIDLMRNAFMEHAGHLETRLAATFDGQELLDIQQTLGLDKNVDHDASAPPPTLEQQAKEQYQSFAKCVWDSLNSLDASAPRERYVAAQAVLVVGRTMPPLIVPKVPAPDPTKPQQPPAKGTVTAGAGHDIEERPPRTFKGYYQQQYGVSLDLHAAAVIRAMRGERVVEASVAAGLLGIKAEDVSGPIAAPKEDGSVGAYNQHLVNADFTEAKAKSNAQQMWDILHGGEDGSLADIQKRLYGDYNDEEQRLIRVAFRRLSGGFDLTFYIRQAIDERKRKLAAPSSIFDGPGADFYKAEGAKTQINTIGADGAGRDGLNPFAATITTGDDAELDRALAISMQGEVDVCTKLRNAVQRNDSDDAICHMVDDLEDSQHRTVLADGPLMDALYGNLRQQNYDRIYKVLTGQADLADRILSDTIGNTWWKRHASGKPNQEGMKDDAKAYVERIRMKYDREVRAEVSGKFEPGQTPDPKEIVKEIDRRTRQALVDISSDKNIIQAMNDVLGADDHAEITSTLLNAGQAHDWAVAGGASPAQILADIRALTPKERADKLNDPTYLRLLGQRLPNEKDYRDAMNALGSSDGSVGLASLDEKSRTDKQMLDSSSTDGRETLRVLAKLSPDEYQRLRSDPVLQAQLLATLDDSDGGKQRKLALELLGAGGPAIVGPKPGEQEDPKVAEQRRYDFLKKQAVYRMKVACQTSNKWAVVLEEAVEVYKSQLGPSEAIDSDEKTQKDGAAPDANTSLQLRLPLWKEIASSMIDFAQDHDDNRGDVSRKLITGDEMIEIIRSAILRTEDPSNKLVEAKILTVEDQAKGDPTNEAILRTQGADDQYKEDDLIAVLNSASDEHVATHWTSIKAKPVGGTVTMLDMYQQYKRAFEVAKPALVARGEEDADPPPDAATNAAAAVADPNAPAAPPASAQKERWRGKMHDKADGDPNVEAAEHKRQQFLHFVIAVSSELEGMLKPHMGDNRELTKAQDPNKVQLKGDGNKRYDNLAEVVLARAQKLNPDVLANILEMAAQDRWMLKSNARQMMNDYGLREQKNLRWAGAQSSAHGADTEKQDLDSSIIDIGRAKSMAMTDSDVTDAEKAKYDKLGDANDRARDAYKTALETTAMWASLIVGTLITIVATILTGGLALGPMAAMAIGLATAALSATAKSMIMKDTMGDEFDSKDKADLIAEEMLTAVLTMGTTFFAQKIMSSVKGLATVAKQANAVKGVITTPPPLWKIFLDTAAEQATQSGLQTVAEAGLEATDPSHFIDGYREGAKEARAAGWAKLKSAPYAMVQGGVNAVLTAGLAKVMRRGGDATHVKYPAAEAGQRKIEMGKNVKVIFGNPADKVSGALVEWAMNQNSTDIDWSKAPAELLQGTIRQYNNAPMDVHMQTVHQAHDGKVARKEAAEEHEKSVKDSLAIFGYTLSEPEKTIYGEMNKDVSKPVIAVPDYAAVRQQVAMTGLATWEGRNPTHKLTETQRHEFIKWCREAADADGLADRARFDPTKLDRVMNAKPPEQAHDRPDLELAEGDHQHKASAAYDVPSKPAEKTKTAAAERPTVKIAAEPDPTPSTLPPDAVTKVMQAVPDITDAAMSVLTTPTGPAEAGGKIDTILHKTTGGKAEVPPREVAIAVAKTVQMKAVAAETAILDATTKEPTKQAKPDPKLAALKASWQDKASELEAFYKSHGLETEDARTKITSAMANPEVAAALSRIPQEEMLAIILHTNKHFEEAARALREAPEPPAEHATNKPGDEHATKPAEPVHKDSGSRHVFEENPSILKLTHLPPEVMVGAHTQARVEPALQAMSNEDYASFRKIESSVKDPVAQGFLLKAVAAGSSINDVAWLAGEMAGKGHNWLVDNLTLGDPRGAGGGIKQQWIMSCNASMTITMRGNMDPVFALKLRLNNESIGEVNRKNPNDLNMNQADLEKKMLESKYQGEHPNSPKDWQGRATPHDGPDKGAGRFADDLLNEQTAATGIVFKPEPRPSGARVVEILDQALAHDSGLQVPLVIGNDKAQQAHYVLAQGRKVSASGEVEYNIHDTGSGKTIWVKASDIVAGTIPGGYNRVGTVEVPTTAPPKKPQVALDTAHDPSKPKAAPGAAHDEHAELRAGIDSVNTEGSFDYRVEKMKQIREDIVHGTNDHLDPDVNPEVAELMKDHIGNVSDAQLAAIQGYSSEDYKHINEVMRHPEADPARTARLKPYIDAIEQGLAGLPPYEGEVYRGAAVDRSRFDSWVAAQASGEPISDPAFSSSSKNEGVADDFIRKNMAPDKVPVFMRIQSRSGKQIEFLSRTANEAEVLFKGGAKFKIMYIEDTVGPDGPRKELLLKEIIDPPGQPSPPGHELPGMHEASEPHPSNEEPQANHVTPAAPVSDTTLHDEQVKEEKVLARKMTDDESALFKRMVMDHGPEAGKAMFDQQRLMPTADQMAMAKPHAQVEVHSHFMGNVEPESFKAQLAAAGGTPSADQLSTWEPLLQQIVDLKGDNLDHKYAKNSDGSDKIDPKTKLPVVEMRGDSGDARAQARTAVNDIAVLKKEYVKANEKRRAQIVAEIDRIAKSAVDKSLRASDETDFNSSYEIRDGLVKQFYGAGERNELLKGLPTNDIANPAVQDAYRKHFQGRPEVLARITLAAEAGARLAEFKDGKLQLTKEQIKADSKLATSISDQIAYDAYAMDTLKRLAEDNIRYTEQSNSAAKLDARFDEAQIPWLKAKLVEQLLAEGNLELAARVKALGVKHVAMVNTGLFGADDPNVDSSDVNRRERPARRAFNDEVAKVVDQTKRKDTVGVDIAGMEHFQFDAEGKARFKYLYDQLLIASKTRGGEPIVLRPHVGEGAGDVETGKHGARDTDRQTTKGELTHYERARQNLEALISVLEQVATEHGGKLPPEVIVRFGHATHTTPEQAARMGKLGIISEVNLQSNAETGSVSQNKDIHAARGETTEKTTHEPDPRARQPVLDDHSLATQIFNKIQIILSTDAHSVMSTDLANEYAQAKKIIDDVIGNRRPVNITAEQASQERSNGGSVDDPGHKEVVPIFFWQMSPEKQALFRHAYEKMFEDAHEYYNRRPKADGGEGSPAHETAKREVDTSAWDTAAKQKSALESVRKGSTTPEERDHLIAQVKSQVPDIELATMAAKGDANTIVSLVFPGGGETGIKRMNDDLVGYALSTELIHSRDVIIRDVFKKYGITIVEQSYKSTTLATSMGHVELATAIKGALAEIDTQMKGALVAVLHKGADHWTAERNKHQPDSDDYKLVDKRVQAIAKLTADTLGKTNFQFNMQVGTADLTHKTGAGYDEVLATKMNANKAAIMAREEGLARTTDRGDTRAMAFDKTEFVHYANDAVGMKEKLKALKLPFHGEERDVIVNGQVDRDLLRALRKGKLDPKTMSEEQQKTLKLLDAYFNRVNSLDYLKRFTKNETEQQAKKVADAQELVHQLEIDMPVSNEAADALQLVLAGTRAQADTASAATFYNEAEQKQNRVILNADIKDMGLDLFESNAKAIDSIASGKKDVASASNSASDGIVNFKRKAENAFRKFYTDRLLPEAIRRAKAQHRPDLVERFQKEPRPLLLLGGDEITVSLDHGFEELGLVGEAVAKLNSPEVANARVSVTETGDASGRAGHMAAMDRSQIGHDLLKSVEEMSRGLDDAADDMSKKNAAAAKALAKRMTEMYTIEQNGRTVLVDPAGKPVDLEALKAQVAEMKAKELPGGPGAAEPTHREDEHDPHKPTHEPDKTTSPQSITVTGHAQFARTAPWTRNPDGAIRTEAQALEIARSHGVIIPDDILLRKIKGKYLPDDTYARYFSKHGSDPNQRINWTEFYDRDLDELVVSVSDKVFESDEAIVAVYAHEMHELNSLRELFEASGGSMSMKRLHDLINPGIAKNLHDQAWDVADKLVAKMRKMASGGSTP